VSGSISDSVMIASAPRAVMDVLLDLERVPDWASGISEVRVLSRDADQRPCLARFGTRTPLGPEEFVLEFRWDGEHGCSWRLVDSRLQRTQDGSYRLVAHPRGTWVHYELSITLHAPIPRMIVSLIARQIAGHALQGLRARVEGSVTRVEGSAARVEGSVTRVEGSAARLEGSALPATMS
jgi:hypothetical protein